MNMKPLVYAFLLINLIINLLFVTANTKHEPKTKSSIIFTTLGKLDYAWDIFALPAHDPPSRANELQLTDGLSLNFNGHFPSPSSVNSIFSINQTVLKLPRGGGAFEDTTNKQKLLELIYVTERNGTHNIYYDAVYYDNNSKLRSRSTLEKRIKTRVQLPLLKEHMDKGKVVISMKDKPTLIDGHLIYISTHENPEIPRASWTAVYSTELSTGLTHRLTPYKIADFSPAVSPSGKWTAVASYGERGWAGEVAELSTDIYIFLTRDGTHRVKVVEHGGWPSWVDDSTFYFHRRNEKDDWISVYRASLPSQGPISTESVVVHRVTPPGLHAFTPAASAGNYKFIAVATRRPKSDYRHVEIFDLVKNEFTEFTRLVSPRTHHLNPFISPDSSIIGYHKCSKGQKRPQLLLENVQSSLPDDVSLFRIDGSFPSFSPMGDRIAYVDFPGVYVVNRDGSNKRQVYPKEAFATAWSPVHKSVVYTSTGPTFASTKTEVDVISIDVDEPNRNKAVKRLTTNGKNNAFPSVSPDGKFIAFRSSRSGYKNLYIMDAINGEQAGLHQLTEGPWSDTMCNWSPDGEWIAFASDRANPGSGSFELYMIHPNGTGLRKVVQSGLAGRTNHPWFSPDGKSLVFTSDYGGISAEPISNPHHFQPYGDIYTVKLDGSDLKRLTHNSYEDGTPSWGPMYMKPVDVEWSEQRPQCNFEDCHWLNEMPIYGVMQGTRNSSTPAQCGA
ncbi:hypothetical protein ACFE04_015183 [Oxalis oulophora]